MTLFKTSKDTLTLLILKQYRIDRGLTQSQFATALGMTRAGWGRMENQKTALNMETFFRVCDEHGTSPQRVLQRLSDHIKVLESRGWKVSSSSIEDDDLLRALQCQPNVIELFGFDRLPIPDYFRDATEKFVLAESVVSAACAREFLATHVDKIKLAIHDEKPTD